MFKLRPVDVKNAAYLLEAKVNCLVVKRRIQIRCPRQFNLQLHFQRPHVVEENLVGGKCSNVVIVNAVNFRLQWHSTQQLHLGTCVDEINVDNQLGHVNGRAEKLAEVALQNFIGTQSNDWICHY